MNNSQVAHLWANQAKPRARGSNFYFEGPVLYSYGGHFCAGRIVENKRKQRAYLLNSDSRSISTGRHLAYARRAIAHGATTFCVPGASPRHEDNRQRFRDVVNARMATIPARRNAYRIRADLETARCAANDYNAYSAFFQLRGRIKVPALSAADAVRLERYVALEAAREAKRAERDAVERAAWEAAAPERARLKAEQDARDAIEHAEQRQAFRDGGPRRNWLPGPVMLRLNVDAGIFETSHGADVPRADGESMLRFLAAHREPAIFSLGAPMAGGFTLRSIEREQVQIGCHFIPMAECAAMAALVGVEWPS